MRTQEEMEAANAQLREIYRAEAKAHCEATAQFGGPLIPISDQRSSGKDTNWRPAPKGSNRETAGYHARMAAFDLLSIAPGPYPDRQEAMVQHGKDIILDQIRVIVGEKVFAKLTMTPDLFAVLKFWEIILRFAEPWAVYDTIDRYRSQLSMNEENERRRRQEAAEAKKSQRKPGKAKRGKAVRR